MYLMNTQTMNGIQYRLFSLQGIQLKWASANCQKYHFHKITKILIKVVLANSQPNWYIFEKTSASEGKNFHAQNES